MNLNIKHELLFRGQFLLLISWVKNDLLQFILWLYNVQVIYLLKLQLLLLVYNHKLLIFYLQVLKNQKKIYMKECTYIFKEVVYVQFLLQINLKFHKYIPIFLNSMFFYFLIYKIFSFLSFNFFLLINPSNLLKRFSLFLHQFF